MPYLHLRDLQSGESHEFDSAEVCRTAAGHGFAVPIPLLVPLVPPEARAELGLQ
jgi:hypothetical protein